MSAAFPSASPNAAAVASGGRDLAWPLAGIAFAAAFGLTCFVLWGDLWDKEPYAHGPIVAAIIVWLVLRTPPPPAERPRPAVLAGGWLLFLFGVAAWVSGHAVNLPVLDTAALMPMALGLLLLTGGTSAVRAYWFAVLFLLFMIPLPNFVLFELTGPLKNKVTYITEWLLFHADYPVARSGVILSIGQYQLLVADACSGLNSIFSLSAMGLLYVHLMRHADWRRNVALLAAILPFAIFANLVRVMFLVLLTYHAGDEAGQGFLHGFAGMFVFVVSLLMLFALDKLLGLLPAFNRFEGARS